MISADPSLPNRPRVPHLEPTRLNEPDPLGRRGNTRSEQHRRETTLHVGAQPLGVAVSSSTIPGSPCTWLSRPPEAPFGIALAHDRHHGNERLTWNANLPVTPSSASEKYDWSATAVVSRSSADRRPCPMSRRTGTGRDRSAAFPSHKAQVGDLAAYSSSRATRLRVPSVRLGTWRGSGISEAA